MCKLFKNREYSGSNILGLIGRILLIQRLWSLSEISHLYEGIMSGIHNGGREGGCLPGTPPPLHSSSHAQDQVLVSFLRCPFLVSCGWEPQRPGGGFCVVCLSRLHRPATE